jgi:hypothetical protein
MLWSYEEPERPHEFSVLSVVNQCAPQQTLVNINENTSGGPDAMQTVKAESSANH